MILRRCSTPFDFQLAGVSAAGDLYYSQLQASGQFQFVFAAERGVPGAKALQAFIGEGVSWSPDGSSLGFLKRENSRPNQLSLMTKNFRTGEEHIYARAGGVSQVQTRWSRDGWALLVSTGPGNENDGGLGF